MDTPASGMRVDRRAVLNRFHRLHNITFERSVPGQRESRGQYDQRFQEYAVRLLPLDMSINWAIFLIFPLTVSGSLQLTYDVFFRICYTEPIPVRIEHSDMSHFKRHKSTSVIIYSNIWKPRLPHSGEPIQTPQSSLPGIHHSKAINTCWKNESVSCLWTP